MKWDFFSISAFQCVRFLLSEWLGLTGDSKAPSFSKCGT